jgi:hypothetical protein
MPAGARVTAERPADWLPTPEAPAGDAPAATVGPGDWLPGGAFPEAGPAAPAPVIDWEADAAAPPVVVAPLAERPSGRWRRRRAAAARVAGIALLVGAAVGAIAVLGHQDPPATSLSEAAATTTGADRSPTASADDARREQRLATGEARRAHAAVLRLSRARARVARAKAARRRAAPVRRHGAPAPVTPRAPAAPARRPAARAPVHAAPLAPARTPAAPKPAVPKPQQPKGDPSGRKPPSGDEPQ